jgi:hypothetical protein
MTTKRYRRQDSGLFLPDWVPDDIIHRSHLHQRTDSRKHFIFTPGGGCAGSGCHCDSCILFTDNFSTNDLATGWSQISGSWSIAGNKLTGSGLLTCSTVPSPPGFFAHVVTVTITAVTGQHAQIIFNWSGSGYNYVDVYFNGASSNVSIKTSGGTTISTSANQNFPNGQNVTLSVCVQANTVGVRSANVGLEILTGVLASSTMVVGLGCASSLSFSSFGWYRHASTMAGCPDCGEGNCAGICANGGPAWNNYAIQIQNMAVDPAGTISPCTTAACNAYNGVWIVPWYGSSYFYPPSDDPTCQWTKSDVQAPCVYWMGAMGPVLFFQKYTKPWTFGSTLQLPDGTKTNSPPVALGHYWMFCSIFVTYYNAYYIYDFGTTAPNCLTMQNLQFTFWAHTAYQDQEPQHSHFIMSCAAANATLTLLGGV